VTVAVVEHALARSVPRVDGRSWLRWAAGTFAGVETLHLIGGLAINDWEGWGTFFSVLSFTVFSGAVITALVFGLLVRWGLKRSPRGRNRPALAALAAGLLSVAGYAALFTWAHLLIAPAAVLLGRAGLTQAHEGRGGRAYALAGAMIGVASFAVAAGMLAYALVHDGDYPIDFLG
jgi:hypothetical protein